MNDFAFTSQLQDLPLASSAHQAGDGVERWLTALREADDDEMIAKGMALASDSRGQRLLRSVFGNSPYLTQCAVRDPVFALDVFANGPDAGFAVAMDGISALQESEIDFTKLTRELRRAKLRVALAISIGDITGSWTGEKVTQSLTEFADSALRTACAHALREIASQGAIELQDPAAPESGSGLIVLGMGKYGAGELNYSSDIDIIVFYDEDVIKTDEPANLRKYFVRLGRRLLGLLNERTADGYVFRTDLRLRPDPGATQLAISVKSGLIYYQQRALDWERAAMIKARAVAGDLEAGNRFLEQLESFIWQKSLDFAAVKEIRTIKRQIDIHKGRAELQVPGHNVKLGRGGIREIEFFVQAQQLMWGGRMPEVRCRGTINGLDALVSIGQVFKSRADDLREAYHFLRWVEHRLQMVNDEQTHSVPEEETELSHIAIFLGYESIEDFSRALMKRLKFVESVFVDLFDISLLPDGDAWMLDENSLATDESDSKNLERLSGLGFSNPRIADETVRGWFSSKYAATQSQHALDALTDLMPMLLKVFGRSMRADHSLREFDKLLSHVPANLQFVSMLHSHPHIVGMLGNITGKAPHLVEFLCGNPEVLESILLYDFFDPIPTLEELHREIEDKLSHCRSVSEASATSRKWVADRRFQVAVQLLGGLTEETTASHALSRITETAVRTLVPRLTSSSAGTLSQNQSVILAVGDLGSGEMTWTSPLEAVFVSAGDVNDGDTRQNGHFATLSQCLGDAFAPWPLPGKRTESQSHIRNTRRGGISTCRLEEIGNGYFRSANIDELLTLTQARAVFGTGELAGAVAGRIRDLLTGVKDREALRSDIGSRLAPVPKEQSASGMWTTATLRRELYNLELAVRYLQLSSAKQDANILDQSVRHALEKLRGFDFLDANVANDLIFAFDGWRGLLGVLDVAIGESDDSGDALRIPDDLRPRLSQVADAPDFEACTELLRETSQSVHGHISRIFQ